MSGEVTTNVRSLSALSIYGNLRESWLSTEARVKFCWQDCALCCHNEGSQVQCHDDDHSVVGAVLPMVSSSITSSWDIALCMTHQQTVLDTGIGAIVELSSRSEAPKTKPSYSVLGLCSRLSDSLSTRSQPLKAVLMSETDTDLPKTLIKRIVKRHLNQLDTSDTKRDTQINKDALLAFSESAKIFINYVTATANDVCKESKRQTISIDDIFRALEDTDFLELLEPLKQSLEGKAFQNVATQGCLPTAIADMQT